MPYIIIKPTLLLLYTFIHKHLGILSFRFQLSHGKMESYEVLTITVLLDWC